MRNIHELVPKSKGSKTEVPQAATLATDAKLLRTVMEAAVPK